MWGFFLLQVLGWLQYRMVIIESPIIYSLIHHLSGGFVSFAKKCKFLKWFTQSLNVYGTSPKVFCLLFHSLPVKLLSGVLGRYESGHTCITYIAKSKTKPQGNASHTLWSRRASVWNMIPNSNYFWYSFVSWLSFFGWMHFGKYRLSLFLFFLLFWMGI
jgi:hypothetical protein